MAAAAAAGSGSPSAAGYHGDRVPQSDTDMDMLVAQVLEVLPGESTARIAAALQSCGWQVELAIPHLLLHGGLPDDDGGGSRGRGGSGLGTSAAASAYGGELSPAEIEASARDLDPAASPPGDLSFQQMLSPAASDDSLPEVLFVPERRRRVAASPAASPRAVRAPPARAPAAAAAATAAPLAPPFSAPPRSPLHARRLAPAAAHPSAHSPLRFSQAAATAATAGLAQLVRTVVGDDDDSHASDSGDSRTTLPLSLSSGASGRGGQAANDAAVDWEDEDEDDDEEEVLDTRGGAAAARTAPAAPPHVLVLSDDSSSRSGAESDGGGADIWSARQVTGAGAAAAAPRECGGSDRQGYCVRSAAAASVSSAAAAKWRPLLPTRAVIERDEEDEDGTGATTAATAADAAAATDDDDDDDDDEGEDLPSVLRLKRPAAGDGSAASSAKRARPAQTKEQRAEQTRLRQEEKRRAAEERLRAREQERLRKRESKEQMQAERKLQRQLSKKRTAEDREREMTVLYDPELETVFHPTFLAELQARQVAFNADPRLLGTRQLRWRRTWLVAHPSGSGSLEQSSMENDVVVVVSAETFVNEVHRNSHLRFAAKLKETLPSTARLTLLVEGLETYFRRQTRSTDQAFRALVQGQDTAAAAAAATTVPRRKKKAAAAAASLPTITRSQAEEAMVGWQIESEVFLRLASTAKETAEMLVMFTRSVATAPDKQPNMDFNFCAVAARKNLPKVNRDTHVGLRAVFARQLSQFKGMSNDKAAAVIERFPSPRALVQGFQSGGPDLLSDIPVRKQSGAPARRFGPHLSRLLHRFYLATDGAAKVEV